ncbi:MAG: nitronate monooxygenase, partial [Pseudomonadota bacterium]|nr:nitronate monooxygenase [Pseudomonadota bacterium]
TRVLPFLESSSLMTASISSVSSTSAIFMASSCLGSVKEVTKTADLVDRLEREYIAAWERLQARMS